MFERTTFHKTMNISKRLLDTYMTRQEVIGDNIANVSTPHFKRSEVSFEHELIRALESENRTSIKANMRHEKHIPFDIPKDYEKVAPKIHVEYETSYRNDKNNVDIDREMALLAKNTMNYNMFTQLMSQQYRQVKRVIGVM